MRVANRNPSSIVVSGLADSSVARCVQKIIHSSRLLAELVVEILSALDDEPRERALRVARPYGVALGNAPVLALHVLLFGARASGQRRRKKKKGPEKAGNVSTS